MIDFDCYQVLGVERTATAPEIKAAHRFLGLVLHPDRVRTSQDKTRAEAHLKRVNVARDILLDPEKRQAHDAALLGEAALSPRDPLGVASELVGLLAVAARGWVEMDRAFAKANRGRRSRGPRR